MLSSDRALPAAAVVMAEPGREHCACITSPEQASPSIARGEPTEATLVGRNRLWGTHVLGGGSDTRASLTGGRGARAWRCAAVSPHDGKCRDRSADTIDRAPSVQRSLMRPLEATQHPPIVDRRHGRRQRLHGSPDDFEGPHWRARHGAGEPWFSGEPGSRGHCAKLAGDVRLGRPRAQGSGWTDRRPDRDGPGPGWPDRTLLYDGGARSFISTKTPIRTPSDLAGVRVRSPHARPVDGQLEAMGARPVMVSFMQADAALQKGIVDADEADPATFMAGTLFHVARVYSVTSTRARFR